MGSPFSTAGGGNADKNPHSTAARARGGACRSKGGSATLKEARDNSSPGIIPGDGDEVKPRLDRKRGGKAKGRK